MHVGLFVRRGVVGLTPICAVHRLRRTSHGVVGRLRAYATATGADCSLHRGRRQRFSRLANMAQHEPKAEWDGPPIYVGVIGGSGLYKLDGIEIIDAVNPKTPWGYPSSPISIARTEAGTLVAFLARHGLNHSIAPSHVPSTANIAALKHLGVRTVLAFSAVGSLREEIAPKDFVIPSQIIDRTKGVRRASYFGEGEEHAVIAHATFGDPYDTVLSPIVEGMYVLARLTPVCARPWPNTRRWSRCMRTRRLCAWRALRSRRAPSRTCTASWAATSSICRRCRRPSSRARPS